MNFKRSFIAASCAAALLATVQQGNAAQETTQFDVRIRIKDECKLISAQDIDFGTHGVISVALSAQGAIKLRCTKKTPYQLSLGLSGNSTMGARQMSRMGFGTGTVEYALYRNQQRTALWGATPGFSLAGIGTGNEETIPVFAAAFTGAYEAGSYVDRVRVTLAY